MWKTRCNFLHDVIGKFAALKLEQMVTPDGSKLVSVAEHEAIVATMEHLTKENP